MTDKSKPENPAPVSGDVSVESPSNQNMKASDARVLEIFMETGKGIFLEAQKAGGEQEMQMARLRVDFAKGFINKFFWFLMTIIAIGAAAVFTDNADLGAQIIFAVLGFVGGTGFGLSLRK